LSRLLVIAEFSQQLFEPCARGLVSFDLARPAAGGGVVDKLVFHGQAGA
jgi:hypothetical protein